MANVVSRQFRSAISFFEAGRFADCKWSTRGDRVIGQSCNVLESPRSLEVGFSLPMTTMTVSGATTLNGATSTTGAAGLCNEATDDVTFTISTALSDALILTGAACMQGAVALNDGAIGTTAIACPATFADTISIGGAATISCAVTLGDNATNTVTISGTITLTDDLTVCNDAYCKATDFITVTDVTGETDFSAAGCVTQRDATADVDPLKVSLDSEDAFRGGGSCLKFCQQHGDAVPIRKVVVLRSIAVGANQADPGACVCAVPACL